MIKAKNQLQGQLNASIIHEYPELENVEITPAVEDKVYKSDMYGFDEVLVKGVQAYIDEDIKPEYIKDGVDILGVIGNVVELNGEEKVVTPKTMQQVILPSENKNGITKLTVQPVDNTIDTNITPENIIDGVEILGVVGNYKGIDTSDATVTPDKVLAGTTVYINNEKIEGTLPNNGELEFDPSDEEQQVPEGYTSGGLIKSADITKLNEYDACLNLVNSIDNLGDYTDTTATAEDIKKGKTAYSNGERIVGTYIGFDETQITSHRGMFSKNTNITEMTLNVVNSTELTSTFHSCSALKKVVINNGNNIINMDGICTNCTSLETFEMDNTSSVKNANSLFSGCISLKTVPYLSIKPSMSTYIQNMYSNCEALTDESLNTILLACANSGYTNATYKKLKYIGFSETMATRCQSLSNWQTFVNAGWTTGY